MINDELLKILACPQCKGPVLLNEEKNGLICEKCRLLYEIIDDIPVMLIDKAKNLKNSLVNEECFPDRDTFSYPVQCGAYVVSIKRDKVFKMKRGTWLVKDSAV